VAKIDHHRVETPFEPAIEGVQIPPVRPGRRYTVSAVELFLENLAAHLFQTLVGLLLDLTFRKQVYRRFPLEIFQAQSAARRVVPMQPIQEWLVRHHHDCCSVEGSHACQRLRRFTSGGLPIVVVQHPAQPLAAPDGSTVSSVALVRNDQPVPETLMVALTMIMRHEFANRLPQ